jgi:aminopeptidase N
MIRIRGVLAALCLFFLLAGIGLGQPPAERQPPPAPATQPKAAPAAAAAEPLRTAVDRPIDVRDIRLDLAVDLTKTSVEGSATLLIRTLRPIKHIELDAVDFKVHKVCVACGETTALPVRFNHDGKKLTILLDALWPAGQDATLKIDYRVEKPKAGLHFFGPTKAEPDTPRIVWSQGEPTDNRYWFPCVDEPDQRQTTEIVVTVPDDFEALSNGKLLGRKTSPDGKSVTFDWRQDKPHPSYLVTLVVGQFDVVREDWDGIPVLYYVPKGQKDRVATTFSRTRDMLGFFSKRFGIQYPWDKYAQVVAYRFGGGMENTSATTLGEVLQDERATLDGNRDGLISHELAHQWWGDMVTCRDWAHIWLNEGFASFAEALWDEHKNGADAYAYNMDQKAAGAIRGGKERPIVDRHYSSPGSMFDSRAYPKGAWVLHMLRRRLGDDVFWQGVQHYGSEHRLQSAETSDFRRTLERTSGRNLERFFYDWTERPGNPVLDVTTEYLPNTQQARIVLKQTQAGQPFHFPLTIHAYCSGASNPFVVQQDVTDKEYTLIVPLAGPLTMVDIDPEQGVLCEIKETKNRDLWLAQLQGAPGVPARLRAVQHFRDSKADEDRAMLAGALTREKFWGVQTALASALGTLGGDKAREALLEDLRQADPRVRRACVEALGRLPADEKVATALGKLLREGDPSYAVCGAAMTSYARQRGKDAVAVLNPWLTRPSFNDTFRSSALTALGSTGDPAALDLLVSNTGPGQPRNTRSAALRGLIQLAQKAKLSDAQRQRVVAELTAALQRDDTPAHFTILMALSDLGPLAQPLLPALEELLRKEPSARVREFAQREIDKVRAQAKAGSAAPSDEVKQLREKVERLEREQADLRERLKKLEKVGAKP